MPDQPAKTGPGPYTAQALARDGRLADVELVFAAKSWRLAGRGGHAAEAAFLPKSIPDNALIVLLGSGLGHALDLLLAAPARPIAVVDKEEAILALTGVREKAAAASDVHWIGEVDRRAALDKIMALAARHPDKPLAVCVNPLYARLDPEHYAWLRQRLSAPEGSPGKAKKQPPRILLLTAQYFLTGEITAACQRLGAPLRQVQTPTHEGDFATYAASILTALDKTKPDFVLTTNHMGVDREGVLAHVLGRHGLPLASWFVDNPHLVLGVYSPALPRHTVVFTWDADHLEALTDMGFAGAHHLPLGTDERRFAPPASLPEVHPWRSKVSFLGNSMAIKSGLRLVEADPSAKLRAKAPDIAAAFRHCGDLDVGGFIAREFPEVYQDYLALAPLDRRLAFDTYVMWEATGLYRRELIQRLFPYAPLVAGDPGWKDVLPGEGRLWRYHRELAYYSEPQLFYPLADVNCNATSRQMKGAVNQRVFDVPACGAFLLTDAQPQLGGLFVPGKEVAVYQTLEEASELTAFYLAHPGDRRTIAQAGRTRVLAEHTYVHRLARLFDIMRGGG